DAGGERPAGPGPDPPVQLLPPRQRSQSRLAPPLRFSRTARRLGGRPPGPHLPFRAGAPPPLGRPVRAGTRPVGPTTGSLGRGMGTPDGPGEAGLLGGPPPVGPRLRGGSRRPPLPAALPPSGATALHLRLDHPFQTGV